MFPTNIGPLDYVNIRWEYFYDVLGDTIDFSIFKIEGEVELAAFVM